MERKVEQFEKAILERGLTPIHLILKPREGVKWFACRDTREGAMYALVVYDSKGKALVLPDDQDRETDDDELQIEVVNGGVRINGVVPYRDYSLDLSFPGTEE